MGCMTGTLQTKRNAIKRRADFESWRHEVALEAANEAFDASAGRLRKLYAIEKLAGNCLQKITYEQVERSQTTENGFQKIRDVTGLADVMDIVHKFLNREVEQEQLKNSDHREWLPEDSGCHRPCRCDGHRAQVPKPRSRTGAVEKLRPQRMASRRFGMSPALP